MSSKFDAKFAALLRRPPTEDAYLVLTLGVLQKLIDQYGKAGAAKYLEKAVDALSNLPNR